MKIYYISYTCLPSQLTNSINIVKQCHGFANNNVEIELIYQLRHHTDLQEIDIHSYYNVKHNFNTTSLSKNRFTYIKFLFKIKALSLIQQQKLLIYTREPRIAFYATILSLKTILELHHPLNPDGVTRSKFWKYLYRRMLQSKYIVKVISITDALKQTILVPSIFKKVLISPDASDIPSNNDTVNFTNRNNYRFEVGYTGHLYKGKGMELIFKIAKKLPMVRFHIVGGKIEDIDLWKCKTTKELLTNIIFYGYVTPKDISSYINSFDACLLPNKKTVFVANDKLDIGDFTSPLKMFDYMAHSRPIIASDLPVLREVLNEDNAILCDPENVQEWVDAINLLIANPELRGKLGKRAFKDFEENYTWKIRAKRILDSLNE